MDTAVYAFYATFSFVCSCIFLIASGLGLYSLYLTRQGGEIPEEAKKKNLSFLYNRTIGIAFLIGGIIFGIAGYRMSPSAVAERMGISLEAEHHPEEAVHKKGHHVVKAGEEVKKAEAKKEEKAPARVEEKEAKKEVAQVAKEEKAAKEKQPGVEEVVMRKAAGWTKTELALKKTISVLQEQLKSLKKQVEEKTAAVSSMGGELAKLKAEVESLRKENQELKAVAGQGGEFKKELDALKKENQQLKQQIAKLEEAKAALEKELSGTKVGSTALKNALEENKALKAKISAMDAELAKNAKMIEETRNKISELSAKLADAKSKLMVVERERDQLRAQLARASSPELRIKYQQAIQEIEALKEKNRSLEQSLKSLTDSLDMKIIDLTELQSKYGLLKDQAKFREEKINKLMEANKAMQERLSLYNTRIRTLEAELKAKDDLIKKLQERFGNQGGVTSAPVAPQVQKTTVIKKMVPVKKQVAKEAEKETSKEAKTPAAGK